VNFVGTRLDLITTEANTSGIARITLDSGSPQLVDFYAAATVHQVRAWSAAGLSNTWHTVKIEYTGSKNASSAGTAIGVDAFDVDGVLTADTLAPNTSSDADGLWHSTDQTVTLTATDTGTWVANTFYRVGSSTTTYTAPIHVSAEGTTTIRYWSADAAGNVEASHSVDVRIDRTAPSSSDDATSAWQRGPITVHLSATDAGSGVSSNHAERVLRRGSPCVHARHHHARLHGHRLRRQRRGAAHQERAPGQRSPGDDRRRAERLGRWPRDRPPQRHRRSIGGGHNHAQR
jgi:hypothetical protein